MLLDVTQLTAGIAKPWSCAVSSRSIIAWPVSTPGCTLGGSFGYSPIAQSSVHGKPISSAAVPARAVAGGLDPEEPLVASCRRRLGELLARDDDPPP